MFVQEHVYNLTVIEGLVQQFSLMSVVLVYVHSAATEQNIYHGLSRILKAGLKGDIIQTQELPLVISTVCNGFAGYLFAWDFIQENWDRIIEK